MSVLDEENDAEFCDRVFVGMPGRRIDVASYGELERVLTLVWHSFGIIGNGGFQYLFEGSFRGDPGFIYTAAAYHRIGAMQAYGAFRGHAEPVPQGHAASGYRGAPSYL